MVLKYKHTNHIFYYQKLFSLNGKCYKSLVYLTSILLFFNSFTLVQSRKTPHSSDSSNDDLIYDITYHGSSSSSDTSASSSSSSSSSVDDKTKQVGDYFIDSYDDSDDEEYDYGQGGSLE